MIDDPLWPRVDQWLADPGAEPEVALIGVPTAVASLSPSRADLTPGAIRSRLGRFSPFHGELSFDLTTVPLVDRGNLAVEAIPAEKIPEDIAQLVRDLPGSELTLFVGGDNAITRPVVRSLGDLDGVGVITFDAHHDVRTLEPVPSNGSPIRGLISEDGLPGSQVAQVGIHSFSNSRPYRGWCDDHGIGVFTMETVESGGLDATVAAALEYIGDVESIHVDVDMDVLDSTFAPACPGA
ncbi:MAG: hypothetical protein GEU71_18670, partial [Actinobacteria bacterium]|nr:hypothetical protein [Actinomycetota bacterium]